MPASSPGVGPRPGLGPMQPISAPQAATPVQPIASPAAPPPTVQTADTSNVPGKLFLTGNSAVNSSVSTYWQLHEFCLFYVVKAHL